MSSTKLKVNGIWNGGISHLKYGAFAVVDGIVEVPNAYAKELLEDPSTIFEAAPNVLDVAVEVVQEDPIILKDVSPKSIVASTFTDPVVKPLEVKESVNEDSLFEEDEELDKSLHKLAGRNKTLTLSKPALKPQVKPVAKKNGKK